MTFVENSDSYASIDTYFNIFFVGCIVASQILFIVLFIIFFKKNPTLVFTSHFNGVHVKTCCRGDRMTSLRAPDITSSYGA